MCTKDMKTGFFVLMAVAIALAVMVVMGMGKISNLKSEIAELKEGMPAKSSGEARPSTPRPAGRVLPTKSEGSAKSGRAAVKTESPTEGEAAKAEQSPEEMIGALMKAFSESEAGQKMEQAENIKRAKRVFKPLLAEFNFSDEEEGHFLALAGAEAGSDDGLWGKLMFAKKEDRETVMQEWEDASAQRQREMESFLNSGEDWKRYQDYEARLPEYEQVNGLREAMEDAGHPLNEDQESQLVEVMHSNRVQSGISQRWEGRGVLNQVSQPGIVQRLETDWNAGQGELNSGVSQILSPDQVQVFNVAQKEMLEEVTQGLGFVEATFNRGGGATSDDE
jgi:hypothetical protein